MKKLLCLLLCLACLCSPAALATGVEDAYAIVSTVNNFLAMVLGEEEAAYTSAGELDGIGVSFGNDDGTLSLLLMPGEGDSGVGTGVIICSDAAHVSKAVYTLCTLPLISTQTISDGLAVGEWIDASQADIVNCFTDPAFDAGEESEPYIISFEGDAGMSAQMTIMRLEGTVTMYITFAFEPALTMSE